MIPGKTTRGLLTAMAVLALGGLAGGALAAPKARLSEPNAMGGRISPDQYVQIIADVFGPEINAGGRFEPGTRQNGLLAVGSSQVTISATGIEWFNMMADSISAQVVSERRRGLLFPCVPASQNAADEKCARQFFESAGRLLYRRPLSTPELDTYVRVASEGAGKLKNFYEGIQLSLANMLISPPFLFREEFSEPVPGRPGKYQLSSLSKASRLSFLLWNAGPDRQLLEAAEKGELATREGLERQVDRLLNSPRLENGVRAFFSDMLHFDELGNVAKDPQIYPKFSSRTVQDAREQTLKTIVDTLLTDNGDYRDLFTTRRTFLTRGLASVYGIPINNYSPIGAPDAWVMHEYAPNDPRSGILTHISFLALHSHPGRSSPTIRGKALREVLLCQKVPDPPGNVDFTVVQDTSNTEHRTARARLDAHATQPMCSGCHKITDPLGLALENFDSSGGFRRTENDVAIDTSGAIDGVKFQDASGLGAALGANPATSKCVVKRLYDYALGRPAAGAQVAFARELEGKFQESGYRFKSLLRAISLSDAFYEVPKRGAAGGEKVTPEY